jgi:hypothetical protein
MTRTRLLIGQQLFKEDKTEPQSRGNNDNDNDNDNGDEESIPSLGYKTRHKEEKKED